MPTPNWRPPTNNRRVESGRRTNSWASPRMISRNPPTVIIGSAELFHLTVCHRSNQQDGWNIVGAGQRMFQLIKDLLDANAIEQGKFTSNIEKLGDLQRSTAARCDQQSNARDAQARSSSAPKSGGPIWVARIAMPRCRSSTTSSQCAEVFATQIHRASEGIRHERLRRHRHWDQGPGLQCRGSKRNCLASSPAWSAQPTDGELHRPRLSVHRQRNSLKPMAKTPSSVTAYSRRRTFTLGLPALRQLPKSPCQKPSAKSDSKLRPRWISTWQGFTQLPGRRGPSRPWISPEAISNLHPPKAIARNFWPPIARPRKPAPGFRPVGSTGQA